MSSGQRTTTWGGFVFPNAAFKYSSVGLSNSRGGCAQTISPDRLVSKADCSGNRQAGALAVMPSRSANKSKVKETPVRETMSRKTASLTHAVRNGSEFQRCEN